MNSPKLTLLVGNNSVRVIHDEPPSPNVPCAFLLVILTSSLVLNASVLLAVVFSTLKSSLYNCLIAFLSAVAMLEALVNVTSSVVVRASWEELYHHYGPDTLHAFCRINASTMQFTSVLQCFALCALSLDRSALIKANSKQNQDNGDGQDERKKTSHVWKNMTPFGGLIAIGVVLPMALGVVVTRLVEQRFSCSPVYVSLETTSVAAAVVLLTVGFCLPLILIFKSWSSITKRVLNERRRLEKLELVARQRAAERRSPVRGLGSSLGGSYVVPWGQIWGPVNYVAGEGFRFHILAASLVFFYTLLVLPNVVSVQITQFFHYYETVKEPNTFLMQNMINKSELPPDLIPIETHVTDSVFVWTRYCFTILSPLLVFIVHKEVKKQIQSFLCACSNKNAIGQSQARSVSAYVKELKDKDFRRKHEYQKKRKPDKYKRVADYRTPVLFATSEGLHLRTVEVDADIDYTNLKKTSSKTVFWTAEPKFVCEFCDVVSTVPNESPRKRKVIPKLSQTPPFARSVIEPDVRLEDEFVFDRKGKCVRFAQRVSEIPLTESGVYSSDDQPTNQIQIQPAKNQSESYAMSVELKTLPNRVSFDRLQEKRFSDTFIKFPNESDISKSLSRDRNKSLELDLIQNGKLNESSASLLLSLSQRMRNRNS